jgi:phosphatidylserine decarboxylase
VALQAARWAPKNLYSGVVGWGARQKLPAPLRAPAYTAFARTVGAELSEVELPLSEYPSFGAFFARGLRRGARPIETASSNWVSPCDGQVIEVGSLSGGAVEAKGRGFHLDALVVDGELASALLGGNFATIYLSPRDYHRVHSPADCRLRAVHYVPGTLFPVSPLFVEGLDQLFARNERLVLDLEVPGGRAALVMVGACGVGNLRLDAIPLESRRLRGQRQLHTLCPDEPLALSRGQLLGAFELGSTVILCAGRDVIDILVEPETTVQFGSPLAASRLDLEKH